MEEHLAGVGFGLGERVLRLHLGHLVDEYCPAVGRRSQRDQVVSLVMPCHLDQRLGVRNLEQDSLLLLRARRLRPCHHLLLALDLSSVRLGLPPHLEQLRNRSPALLQSALAQRHVKQHALISHRGCDDGRRGVGVPCDTRDRGSEVPLAVASPARDLPNAHGPVARAGRKVLPRGVHGQAVDLIGMTLVDDGEGGGVRLELLGLGQRGQERLRVDVHALLDSARAEVQIQTALEALVEEAVVQRHLPEGVVLAGDEVEGAIRRVMLHHLLLLLLRQQILLRRVVGLCVTRQFGLRRWDRYCAAELGVVLGLPHVVVVLILLLLLGRRSEHLTRADHAHVLNDLLGLVLRRHKATLGLGTVRKRVDLVLWRVVRLGVVLVRVVAGVEFAGAETSEQLHFGVGQAQLLVVDFVVDRAPTLRVVCLVEMPVQCVLLRLANDLLSLQIVANVLLVPVPFHRDLANRIPHDRTVLL
mmetsp:Transcript_52397/g.123802  ORF Transcript_52397/g.123802 Transcript_52397/m.123802 type:complete len:472 (-) Transcript_52397:314-1729(-)